MHLFRKREIWAPTLWGWLTLGLAAAAAAVGAARGIHPFLAVHAPVGARVLIVEGWLDPEGLDQAVRAYRAGGYVEAVTTGGPLDWPGMHLHLTYAERAADYLRRRGLAGVRVTAVAAPASAQDRTYLSAVMVRDWLRRDGAAVEKIDVFSMGAHARRTRYLYRLAFGPKVEVGIYAGQSSDYDPAAWWHSAIGAREVLDQGIGYLWVRCFFRPPSADSHAERWGLMPAPDTRERQKT